jgi:hypothetical protein
MDSQGTYQFQFRPRGNKGTQLRISALGMAGRQNRRSDLLLIPPSLRAQVEWINAAGRIAIFSLTPRFIENVADQAELPAPFPAHNSLLSLSIDLRFEELCQLLVEETEENCLHGPLYFEALARALALRLLRRARDRQLPVRTHAPGIPPGMRVAIQRLEDDFSERISVTDLARVANLSVDYFTCAFRKADRLDTSSVSVARPFKPGAYNDDAKDSHSVSGRNRSDVWICRSDAFLPTLRRFFGMTPTAFLETQKCSGVRQRSRNCTLSFE